MQHSGLEKVLDHLGFHNADRRLLEEQLSVVWDALGSCVNGVIITDIEGCIKYVNDAFLKMFEYPNKETILRKNASGIFASEEIKKFSQYLVTSSKELITPSFDVMSHTINGIMVSSQGFSKEAIEAARKFRYGRTFCLGIKGWCDIRLLLIDIKNSCVFCNAKGKEIVEVYIFSKKKIGGDKKQPIKNDT